MTPPARRAWGKNDWKLIATVSGLVVGCILAMFLGARSSDEPTVDAELAPSVSSVITTSPETMFVNAVRQKTGLYTDFDVMLNAGREICKTIDAGISTAEINEVGRARFGAENSAFITEAAIKYLCPDPKEQIG